jgi:propionate CoA-transferase
MNLFTKASLVLHVLRWRRSWDKRDTHFRFTVPGNPKFMGSRDAVQLIRDGDVIATSGIAGNQPIAILYWAIREVYEETSHPANLTLFCTGGQGGRGKVPGSMEELGKEGLCTRLITGHQETFKAMLALATAGKLEIQCLPQGEVAFLMEAQGRGEDSILTSTGVGTFMDPRVGPGSRIFDPKAEQLVTVEGDKLRYRAPKISVAMFSAPAADREGNLYLDNASVIAETYDIIRAARKNGGRVIVHVGCIVEKGAGKVVIPAEDVDAIVYDPIGQQALSIKHSKYWPLFTTRSDLPQEEAISRLRFTNRLLGITPRRTPIDEVLARLAALTFAENARKGMFVNIGVGLPEEACRILFEAGLLQEVTVFTESGVIGGLPAPGIFFGAAACPKKIVRSAEAFHICAKQLDVTLLGVLEADSEGNVNVSKRGKTLKSYVGPGGFIDITTGAHMIVFVTSWMAHADIRIEGGRIKIAKPGEPKFVDKVSEITFSGKQALKAGKKVFYVTTVGVFQLTERGVELIRVMPGIDIQKDILAASPMKIVLPLSGDVPVVNSGVVTGAGYKLAFPPSPQESRPRESLAEALTV